MANASRAEQSSTLWWLGFCGVALALIASAGPAESMPQPPATGGTTIARTLSDGLFAEWPAGQKPYLVLVLTGQQHSYLKFCGCTERQLGGFERRYNFISKLREKGWPVVSVDLGDLVMQQNGTQFDQSILKFDTEMKALAALDYSGIALGELDFKLDLLKALANTAFQDASKYPPLLCGNLADRTANFPGADGSIIENAVVRGGKNGVPRVGIVGVAGPSVMKHAAALNLKFETINSPQGPLMSAKPALTAALQMFAKEKVDFRVLLYQGNFESARSVAGAPNAENQVDREFADRFDVILCLCAEEEPPARAEMVGKTMIVRVGQRGRHIGVVGVFKKPDGQFDKFYQFVEMSEDWETDADKEQNNPILKILDGYAKEVRDQGFVKKTPQIAHPVQTELKGQAVAFIGSDKCKTCHPLEYAIWEREIIASKKKHSHSKAYEALVKYAKKPKLRQFDPECVVCHTVGYGFQTGYHGEEEARLKNVGCENCHGPGNPHAADPKNPAFHRLLSPWKSNPQELLPSPDRMQLGYNSLTPAEQRILKNVNDGCQKCHDTDNDPTFKFEKFWPRILHGRGREPVDPAKLAPAAANGK